MGKAAENEKLKLRALFWNNLAVASAAAGAVVPYLSLSTNSGHFVELFHQGALFSNENIFKSAGPTGAFFFACYVAWTFRKWANLAASGIQD